MVDKIQIDHRDNGDEYELTDSEEYYSEEEKEILKEVRKGRQRFNEDSKNAVLAFADSSDEEAINNQGDDDVNELMHDSDIEGGDGGRDADIPDSKDWGSKSRNYYHTDFVDQDYSTYNEQEEEMAKQEEEEAKVIQLRLAKQMKEEDFFLDEVNLSPAIRESDIQNAKAKTLADSTRIKIDFSGLSKRQRQQFFQNDSPEFYGLITDFEEYMKETEMLLNPILQYVKENNVPMIPALEFTQAYQNLVLTYCSNVSFYLLLKAKRITIKKHPITKRLVQLKKLLGQLKEKYDNIIRPQLEALLERIIDGDEFEVLEVKPAAVLKKAKKLSIIDQYNVNVSKKKSKEDLFSSPDEEEEEDEEMGDEEPEQVKDDGEDGDERRGINYQISKNKGLTPHRKKEQRNPRVKHRNKFRKALIRRKGAVRTVRTETKRYGGEISGIKASVNKSIKFKS